jgi:glyoxylase-like metal-dependent hydrolase (beta-lactamase superfamily II)
VFEVAAGVHRIPLPLPASSRLQAVNVYAIVEDDGFVLIDSGWALETARDQLQHSLGVLGGGIGDVSRFLMTHVHRDHYTLGVALRREFGNKLSLGRGETDALRLAAIPGRTRYEGQLGQLHRAGADELVAQLGRQQIAPELELAWEDP